jgi:hypothetical protein
MEQMRERERFKWDKGVLVTCLLERDSSGTKGYL